MDAFIRFTLPLRYETLRRLMLVGGSIVLAVLAALMYARGVDPREVLATGLFIPVFLAALFYGTWAGIAAGAAAAAAYVGLLWSAIDIVGFGAVAGTIMSRSLSYLVFGGISGWAIAQLEAPISKLERHDHIDDVTGLYNARFFLEATELEEARATRYGGTFSVVSVVIPDTLMAPMSAENRTSTVRRLGEVIVARSRSVDRVVHAADQRRHLFALVLPETGRDGADILAADLRERLIRALGTEERTRVGAGSVDVRVAGRGVDGSLDALRDEFMKLDLLEHPPRSRT